MLKKNQKEAANSPVNEIRGDSNSSTNKKFYTVVPKTNVGSTKLRNNLKKYFTINETFIAIPNNKSPLTGSMLTSINNYSRPLVTVYSPSPVTIQIFIFFLLIFNL